MKIIQLHLPDDLAGKVSQLFPNTESFIIETLRTKVKEHNKSSTLENEYHLASLENEKIKTDFAAVDLENWSDEY
ncbi:MAG TPA: hypothetical protein PK546_08815 [Chitinophagales bacterium]|jgi:hypothetical protein|nr:hypothetical protein [Chitinophagales bacterium]MBP6661030.1 hypothetical protein [Chitinophagales bacterium]HPN19634.1 hypothetical protein [Chitinophagales bacterium]